MKTFGISLAILLLAIIACPAHAQRPGPAEWPQWRGPGRTGRSSETGLLERWPQEGPRKVWTARGLGKGFSSISVKDGRIYTMGTENGKETVFALNFETGEKIWSAESSPRVFTERRGNGPRSTPTCDGKYLYTEDAFGNVTCYEAANGRKVWRKSLTADFGGAVPRWGYSESPLIVGKAVIVTPGGSRGAIVTLDKRTGRLIWQSKDVRTPVSYTSPILAEVGGRKMIVNALDKRMVGVDATTGRFLWDFNDAIARICAATPIVHDGVVFGSSGYRQGSGAARIGQRGAKKLWYNPTFGNHHGGVIRLGDYLYGFFDGEKRRKTLMCVEMKTGRVAWSNPSVGKGSLVYADGHLYLLSESNVVGLAVATPDGYTERGRFRISGSGFKSWAHPVVVGGRLFIRNQDSLACYDVKAK